MIIFKQKSFSEIVPLEIEKAIAEYMEIPLSKVSGNLRRLGDEENTYEPKPGSVLAREVGKNYFWEIEVINGKAEVSMAGD